MNRRAAWFARLEVHYKTELSEVLCHNDVYDFCDIDDTSGDSLPGHGWYMYSVKYVELMIESVVA